MVYMLDVLYSLCDFMWIVFCRFQLNVKQIGHAVHLHALQVAPSSIISLYCQVSKTQMLN